MFQWWKRAPRPHVNSAREEAAHGIMEYLPVSGVLRCGLCTDEPFALMWSGSHSTHLMVIHLNNTHAEQMAKLGLRP